LWRIQCSDLRETSDPIHWQCAILNQYHYANHYHYHYHYHYHANADP
jgi:hypothetical protein